MMSYPDTILAFSSYLDHNALVHGYRLGDETNRASARATTTASGRPHVHYRPREFDRLDHYNKSPEAIVSKYL